MLMKTVLHFETQHNLNITMARLVRFLKRSSAFSEHELPSRTVYSYSCKRNKSDSSGDYPKNENPIGRTFRILGNDMKTVKSFLFRENETEPRYFARHCDVAIIGGGIMGSSIAYWLKQRAPQGLSVTVVEKDPTYSSASTVLSLGGLRQQFSIPENIQMSMFGAEFLRNIKQHLSVAGHDPPSVQFTPNGYLFLATEQGAEQLKENACIQMSLGVKNQLLTPTQLKKKFPWLDTNGIELGCYGLENEGWFDPWLLLDAFKKKAINLGAEYIQGEVVGFTFKKMEDMIVSGVDAGGYEAVDELLVRRETGDIHPIKFALVIIAAGANSGSVAKLAKIGGGSGLLSVPLPVEPRKRYVYCFNCKDGPGLNTPLLIDPTGTYFRRDGLAGNYVCGRSPEPSEEPGIENLDVDYNFFDTNVWPVLANRVPSFQAVKVKSAWSGYYEYNTYDANGIIGPHPYYHNLYVATGFSGHGIQQGPAVGRAIMELILDGGFQSINLSRMGFERLYKDQPLVEQNIW